MKQYNAIKERYPDAILLFRVGDFYETFCDDAIKASKILNITLTKRSNGKASFIELAGFPYHALDNYMPKLVLSGERVAICEQLENPKTAKGIVKRGITELITPGVSLNSHTLQNNENNFLASIYIGKKQNGVSFLDITTGEFFVASGDREYIQKLISALNPKEILCQRSYKDEITSLLGRNYFIFPLDEWVYSTDTCYKKLTSHFKTQSLKAYGIENSIEEINSAGAVLHYLNMTEHKNLDHIVNIKKIDKEKYVSIDHYSLRNLEILEPNNIGSRSLFSVINKTVTPMGMRLLRHWLSLPLKDSIEINNRLDLTEYLINSTEEKDNLSEEAQNVHDLERLITRVSAQRATPREIEQIGYALTAIQKIKSLCEKSENITLKKWGTNIDDCEKIKKIILSTIIANAPSNTSKGNYIASGVSEELDQLRKISINSKEFLCKIQSREAEETGITSLKIGFNNVFGYYIEVRNTHKDRVPEGWIRKQTLANAERYITPELKEYEEKILGAQERILTIEQTVYDQLLVEICKYTLNIQTNAKVVAHIDVMLSFAESAKSCKFAKPKVNDEDVIDIVSGRHPVIESSMAIGESYIPNDIHLSNDDQQIIIITGPNMSGKSAILRQTAIITILAQCGSYVPAKSATIGIVDKVFTRVGASDNLSEGESTFMVEMLESANILNNVTSKSLVLLDEIGRGTSTYDGLSIAWAMVEYIHEREGGRAKTLFATHYHELNEMATLYNRVKNFNVQIKEIDNKIVFLRKLIPGGTEHSFGIHVARMAGMPNFVVNRADEILKTLEKKRDTNNNKIEAIDNTTNNKEFMKYKQETKAESGVQLSLFQLDDPLVADIRKTLYNVDINNMTPIEAFTKLTELKNLIGQH
ncbi:MAG: DNA mismatch repair protein MutS [Bacteroidetes bacterium]|nr:DNA mismatch repair protein MutS [Bacteroidota bacterium]